MPELPEVEVTRRSVGGIAGARVLALRLGKPLRWPLGCDPAALTGQRVGEVSRRGKYLWLPLALPSGEAAGGLLAAEPGGVAAASESCACAVPRHSRAAQASTDGRQRHAADATMVNGAGAGRAWVRVIVTPGAIHSSGRSFAGV